MGSLDRPRQSDGERVTDPRRAACVAGLAGLAGVLRLVRSRDQEPSRGDAA
jgi:hypothetical protein